MIKTELDVSDVRIIVEGIEGASVESVSVSLDIAQIEAFDAVASTVTTPAFTSMLKLRLGASSIIMSEPPYVASKTFHTQTFFPPPPPPQPPPPPPPPWFPPLPELLAANIADWLDVSDYLNVSNPASAALGGMLSGPQAAPARAAAAVSVTVSVTTSVAASAGSSAASSAAGSAAGGGGGGPAAALPALMMAQRFALMGKLGGGDSTTKASSEPDPTAWMTGTYFSPFSGASETDESAVNASEADESAENLTAENTGQRRLQKSSKGSGTGGGGQGRATVQRKNQERYNQMLNVSFSFILIGAIGAACHQLLLLLWRFVFNRRYYRYEQERVQRKRRNLQEKSAARPSFRPLPGALVWPNFEITLILIFAAGIVQAASSILASGIDGTETAAVPLALASFTLCSYVWFIAAQIVQLTRFYRQCGEACWTPAEQPVSAAEVEDPLLRLLVRARLVRPRAREQGAFEPPVDSTSVEPQRTEDVLRRSLLGVGMICPRSRRRRHSNVSSREDKNIQASQQLELLPNWLKDASGSRSGAAFGIVQLCIQLVISVNIGFWSGHSYGSSAAGGKLQLWLLVGLQGFAAIFTGMQTANDFWFGVFTALAYAIEFIAASLLLRGTYIADSEAEGTDKDARVIEAIALSVLSAQLLMINLFAPMALTAYDLVFVPIYHKVKQQDAGSPRELVFAILQALMTASIQMLGAFGVAPPSLGGSASDVLGEASSFANEASSATRVRTTSLRPSICAVRLSCALSAPPSVQSTTSGGLTEAGDDIFNSKDHLHVTFTTGADDDADGEPASKGVNLEDGPLRPAKGGGARVEPADGDGVTRSTSANDEPSLKLTKMGGDSASPPTLATGAAGLPEQELKAEAMAAEREMGSMTWSRSCEFDPCAAQSRSLDLWVHASPCSLVTRAKGPSRRPFC